MNKITECVVLRVLLSTEENPVNRDILNSRFKNFKLVGFYFGLPLVVIIYMHIADMHKLKGPAHLSVLTS